MTWRITIPDDLDPLASAPSRAGVVEVGDRLLSAAAPWGTAPGSAAVHDFCPVGEFPLQRCLDCPEWWHPGCDLHGAALEASAELVVAP